MLIVGREGLARNKRHLQCVLISTDISPGSRDQILRDFADYPVLQRFSSRNSKSTSAFAMRKFSVSRNQVSPSRSTPN